MKQISDMCLGEIKCSFKERGEMMEKKFDMGDIIERGEIYENEMSQVKENYKYLFEEPPNSYVYRMTFREWKLVSGLISPNRITFMGNGKDEKPRFGLLPTNDDLLKYKIGESTWVTVCDRHVDGAEAFLSLI